MSAEAVALVIALAAAAAPAAPAAEPVADPASVASAARGSPRMTVEPAALVLGRDPHARITVVTGGGEAPRLQTTSGRIQRLAETAPGTWTAELAAPVLTHPQVALVLATTSSGAAFVPVPLLGKGVAVARTAPGSSVSVRVGARTFGPVVADAEGVARVPVEIPPGERFAQHGPRRLDLSLPPVRRVLLAVAGEPLRADRDAELAVHLAAATPEGAPWTGAPVTFTASAGALSQAVEVAPGLYSTRWRIAAGAPGRVTIEARAGDERSERIELERPAGPAARVELALGRERATAGDAPFEVTAAALDVAGNPVEPEPRLEVSGGTLTAATRAGPGKVRATWTPPRALEGRTELTVTATAGTASARRAVPLAPGAPTTLSLDVAPDALPGDGVARAEVRVAVADAYGNPLPEVPAITADRGGVGPPAVGPGGGRIARYTAPWDWRPQEEAVVARAGALVSGAKVRLAPAPQQLAVVARAGVQRGLGGTGPYAGGGVEAWPLRLGGAYGLGLDLAWTAPPRRTGAFAVNGGAHTVSTSASACPISLTALARARLAPRLVGFAGAGGGAVAVHGTVQLDGRQTSDEWGLAPEAHVAAALGLDVPWLRARVRLEARAGWQGAPSSMSAFEGSARTFTLALGVTHDAL